MYSGESVNCNSTLRKRVESVTTCNDSDICSSGQTSSSCSEGFKKEAKYDLSPLKRKHGETIDDLNDCVKSKSTKEASKASGCKDNDKEEVFIQMEACYYYCLIQLKIKLISLKDCDDGKKVMRAYDMKGCCCMYKDNKLFSRVCCCCSPVFLFHLPLDHELVNYIHPEYIKSVKVLRSKTKDRLLLQDPVAKGTMRMMKDEYLEQHSRDYIKYVLKK